MLLRCPAHNLHMAERRGRLKPLQRGRRALQGAPPGHSSGPGEFPEQIGRGGVCAERLIAKRIVIMITAAPYGNTFTSSRHLLQPLLRHHPRSAIAQCPAARRAAAHCGARRRAVERAPGRARSDRGGAPPQAAARRRDRGQFRHARTVGARPRLRPAAGRHGAAPARPDRRADRRLPQHAAGAARRRSSTTSCGSASRSSCSCAPRRMPRWRPASTSRRARGFLSHKGLVNAVLAAAQRRGGGPGRTRRTPPRLNTPDWLWRSWSRAYGEERARAIATAHLKEAPLDLTLRDDAR